MTESSSREVAGTKDDTLEALSFEGVEPPETVESDDDDDQAITMLGYEMEVRLRTDAQGKFRRIVKKDLPVLPVARVKIRAQLLGPPGASVDGRLDVDAEDGRPRNNACEFSLRQGEPPEVVGKFKVRFGGEMFVIKAWGVSSVKNGTVRLRVIAR